MTIDNFKDGSGRWAQYSIVKRYCHWTKSGSVWSNIRNRCNPNNEWQKISPHYVGCTMSENFKDFQFFTEWHIYQVGFGIRNYSIDKDILVEGNKEYHEDKCVLVPHNLNNFFIRHPNTGSGLPQGVCFHIKSGKFCANLNSFGKTRYIGSFWTIEEASFAYEKAKAQEAVIWINKIKSGEFIVDPRVIERLETLITK